MHILPGEACGLIFLVPTHIKEGAMLFLDQVFSHRSLKETVYIISPGYPQAHWVQNPAANQYPWMLSPLYMRFHFCWHRGHLYMDWFSQLPALCSKPSSFTWKYSWPYLYPWATDNTNLLGFLYEIKHVYPLIQDMAPKKSSSLCHFIIIMLMCVVSLNNKLN